ncbi:MAG: penicillin-binding protein 2 [Deltaproteobacteria bacterium]|nr:penicillin-binding protein 2 [Deltaproteobacteria bacterium]
MNRSIGPLDLPDVTDFEGRFKNLAVVAFILVIILVLRLFYLQILEGETYYDLSIHNRIRLRYLMPLRGLILDRHGRILVSNRPSFSVYVDMDYVRDQVKLANELAEILGFTQEEIMAQMKLGKREAYSNRILLKSDVSWAELSLAETRRYEIPGLVIQAEPKRDYVYPGLASHVLGYLGEINKDELDQDGFSGTFVGEYIGKSGIEKAAETYLRGRKGGRHIEVDAAGRETTALTQVDALPGDNVYLSLDMDRHRAIEEQLQDKVGAVVAMDPVTGEVLGMASSPGFDQNIFVQGISTETWKAIRDNRFNPLQNRAMQGQYSPGSIYKIVTALAALSEGVITPNTLLDCHGSYKLGNREYHCWKTWGHGRVDLKRAITESCDIFFYQVGQRLGVDVIARYAKEFGLSEKTGIVIEPEREGLIPTSGWKLKRFGIPWQKGETLSAAIGQSFNLVTPLQSAILISTVANGGSVPVPALIRRIETAQGRLVSSFEPAIRKVTSVNAAHMDLLRKILEQVVSDPSGTGKKASVENLSVAGKTGTVQIVALKDPKRRMKTEDVPYEFRDHAWFVCFAPVENPRIALSVLVEHGGHAGAVAAPIAKHILETWLRIYGPEDRQEHFAGADTRFIE